MRNDFDLGFRKLVNTIFNLIWAYFLRRPVVMVCDTNRQVRLVRAVWIQRPTKKRVGLLRVQGMRGDLTMNDYPVEVL